MDMETDDEDEEDGQIGREEQEEERERRLLSGGQSKAPANDQPITIEDLKKVWLTRDLIAKHCMAPWFEDYVKGVFPVFEWLLVLIRYAKVPTFGISLDRRTTGLCIGCAKLSVCISGFSTVCRHSKFRVQRCR